MPAVNALTLKLILLKEVAWQFNLTLHLLDGQRSLPDGGD